QGPASLSKRKRRGLDAGGARLYQGAVAGPPFLLQPPRRLCGAGVDFPGRKEQGLTPTRHQAVLELLAFYQEAGVDALLEENPTDRFAGDNATAAPAVRAEDAAPRAEERAHARPFSTRERGVKGRVAPPPSPEVAVMAARE